MLKISKKIEYALMALKFMAKKSGPKRRLSCGSNTISENSEQMGLTTVREIASELNIPFDTLAKVLQQLNAHKVLKSIKGTKGGYLLDMDLKNLTYAQLVETVEGKNSMFSCLTSKGTICDLHETCNIVAPVDHLNRKITNFLKSLSIEEILFGETLSHTQSSNINLELPELLQSCPIKGLT